MMITQLFIRLIKNEGFYSTAMKSFQNDFYFYNGVIENLLQKFSIRDILFQIGLNAIETNHIIKMWKIELNKNNIKEIKKVDAYTNFATQTLRDFICIYDIEKEVTNVLFGQEKIAEPKINTNDIDKLLRNSGYVRLYRFFSSDKTFCVWDDYNYILNGKFDDEWCNVSSLWETYLVRKKINNVYV